jgi:hypothetical protein
MIGSRNQLVTPSAFPFPMVTVRIRGGSFRCREGKLDTTREVEGPETAQVKRLESLAAEQLKRLEKLEIIAKIVSGYAVVFSGVWVVFTWLFTGPLIQFDNNRADCQKITKIVSDITSNLIISTEVGGELNRIASISGTLPLSADSRLKKSITDFIKKAKDPNHTAPEMATITESVRQGCDDEFANANAKVRFVLKSL